MTIDHFGDLSLVRIFGFFTAAEGFVFISGIVAGIVYYGKGQKLTSNQLNHSAMTRSLKIYKYHLICLVCLCIAIALDFGFLLNEFFSAPHQMSPVEASPQGNVSVDWDGVTGGCTGNCAN
jgi:hypothetical protein